MTKLGEIIRYASYLTLTLILFSILSPAALAGNGVGAGNNAKYENIPEAPQKKDLVSGETQVRNQSENKTLERVQLREITQERSQLKEQFKTQKSNYQMAKKNFIAVRKQLRSGNYDEGDLEITREYLNASIDYMIAHLEKVQYNLEQSNGNGTEARITAVQDRISQLQEEKEAIGNASGLEELATAASSVRGTWNNAKQSAVAETGKTASERIDKLLDKSEDIAERLENEIDAMKEAGIETAELEAKLANYNELMDSAEEKTEAAEEIFEKEDATPEELEEANKYLQNALEEIHEANEVLKEIFGKLEPYREQYRLEEQNQESSQIGNEDVDDSADDTEDEDDA